MNISVIVLTMIKMYWGYSRAFTHYLNLSTAPSPPLTSTLCIIMFLNWNSVPCSAADETL